MNANDIKIRCDYMEELGFVLVASTDKTEYVVPVVSLAKEASNG